MLSAVIFAALLASGAAAANNPSSQTQNPSSATISIPAGTILPVGLPTLSSQKSKKGAPIKARIMQDVPLPNGEKIHRGSVVVGHVVDATPPAPGKPASLVLTFDTLIERGKTIPISASLRALASTLEVDSAQIPDMGAGESDVYDWLPTTLIGGETAYGRGGPVARGNTIVGRSTGVGVLVNVSARPGSKCGADLDADSAPQALWLFSSDACGVYGIPHLDIRHSGRTEPVGQIVLSSDAGPVEIRSGSGALLRVLSDGSH